MKWYVYYYDKVKKQVLLYNIFEHKEFCKYIKQWLEECTDKESFEELLLNEVLYYFYKRSQWEMVVTHSPDNNSSTKIGVHDQLKANWSHFLDYVWSLKDCILKGE